MADLDQGNSFVQSPDVPEEKQRKTLQQFDGVQAVKEKKEKSFLNWISNMFFSGRSWKDILMDLIENQIVPELRDGARNALVSAIDMKIYKDFKPGATPTTTVNNGSFITKYIDYAAASTQNIKKEREANQKKDEEIRKSGYELPAFTNERTAVMFLNSLKAEAEKYGQISVHDLAWKQGKNVDYTWDAYGWTNEMIAAIKRPTRMSPPLVVNGVKYTHIIELPEARQLSGD